MRPCGEGNVGSRSNQTSNVSFQLFNVKLITCSVWLKCKRIKVVLSNLKSFIVLVTMELDPPARFNVAANRTSNLVAFPGWVVLSVNV